MTTPEPRIYTLDGLAMTPERVAQVDGMATEAKAHALLDGIRPGTRAEGNALFDAVARRHLNMPGTEFLARWDRGEFDDGANEPAVSRVAALIPLGR